MHAHPRLKTIGLLVDGLAYAAHETTKLALRSYKESKRRSVGGTIRPGPNTPLWNELAVETRRLIRRHGEKVNLARFLGLPKQRVHEFLMARSAGPDAERTLMLLIWVSVKRRGVTLS